MIDPIIISPFNLTADRSDDTLSVATLAENESSIRPMVVEEISDSDDAVQPYRGPRLKGKKKEIVEEISSSEEEQQKTKGQPRWPTPAAPRRRPQWQDAMEAGPSTLGKSTDSRDTVPTRKFSVPDSRLHGAGSSSTSRNSKLSMSFCPYVSALILVFRYPGHP